MYLRDWRDLAIINGSYAMTTENGKQEQCWAEE